MEDNKEIMSIQRIKIGEVTHPIDAVSVEGKTTTDKIEDSNETIPTSKVVFDAIGDVEELLSRI